MAISDDVAPTVHTLLERTDLHLQLVSDRAFLAPGALEREVRWVHSSDLLDPTPFLAPELILLTTGTQFADEDATETTDAYVRRLLSRGVLALGFGTAVVRDGVPATLVNACAEHGLPLFEVPYDTPFIAVARANTEAVAAQAYARRSWSLAAQRAISLAALRPDGLGATVTELSKQLGTWVGLYDAGGVLTREFPPAGIAPGAREQLETDVDAVLRRGARAASALSIATQPFTLQTLGRGGHLRGVIALASPELDQEGRSVVTAVIAMAGLALEQQQRVQRGRASLRAGIIQTLLADDATLARRVGREIGTPLPAAPVVVAIAESLGRDFTLLERLDLLTSELPGSVFFGRVDDDLVLVVPADSTLPADTARRFAARVGVSDPVTYADFSRATEQATIALRSDGVGLIPFRMRRRGGILQSPSDEARTIAQAMLLPLIQHDAAEGTELTATLRAFLENDGSPEATARTLGVHRHTVRTRIQVAERTLGVSLSRFPERAELWAAFRATDRDSDRYTRAS